MEPEQHIDINPTPKPIMTDAPSDSISSPDIAIDVKPPASTSDVGVDTKGVEVEPPKAVEVPIKTIDEDKGKKISELQKKQQAKDVSGEPDAKIIYDNQELDPTLLAIKKSTLESATQKANLNFDETASFNPDYKGKSLDESISEELSKLEASAMDQFLIDYPEKAEKYKDDPAIQAAMERKMNAETQRDQETLRLLGYSEEEIQAEFEKHPYLLANEKITFLMLKNLRDSKDLPEELKTSLLETYNDKLQHIFLRKINEARADDEKVTIEQIKDADMRSLLASLEENPELADKTTQFLQMIEGIVVEKNEAIKEVLEEQSEQPEQTKQSESISEEGRAATAVNDKDQQNNEKISLRAFFKEKLKESGGVLNEKMQEKLKKYQKEGFFDLGEFMEFMIEGGSGTSLHSGGSSEAGHGSKEGEKVPVLGVNAIKEFTMEKSEAEKSLLLQGLAGAGYTDEAKAYSGMSIEDLMSDEAFQKTLFKVADAKKEEFVSGITKEIKQDEKTYALSTEAFAYLLNLPKSWNNEK